MINNILKYIKDKFKEDLLVNTITFSDELVVDTKKENIYPIVAINFLNRTQTEDRNLYNFRIFVLQQRDIKREMQPSKLMDETNFIDNLSECENIIDRFLNFVMKLDVDSLINIENSPQLNMVANYGGNGLDGYQFDLTLSDKLYGYC
jgi:hypothetical protein